MCNLRPNDKRIYSDYPNKCDPRSNRYQHDMSLWMIKVIMKIKFLLNKIKWFYSSFVYLHMQLLPIHFSFNAHTWSESHRGRHIESRHVFPSVQSKFEAHETGTIKEFFFSFRFSFDISNIKLLFKSELTSNTFNGWIAGEASWTRARLEMISDTTFWVHATSLWLCTWIDTLTFQTNFI